MHITAPASRVSQESHLTCGTARRSCWLDMIPRRETLRKLNLIRGAGDIHPRASRFVETRFGRKFSDSAW
jgi:hypothetical protein